MASTQREPEGPDAMPAAVRKVAKAVSKPRKRRGAVSSPCPTCGSNSHVIITSRVEGVVIRTRRCLQNPGHVFKTKEVRVAS